MFYILAFDITMELLLLFVSVILRLILIPITIKQQKSMKKISRITRRNAEKSQKNIKIIQK